MKFIAVSQRVDYVKARHEVRDSLDRRLSLFLHHAGYFAIPVPNSIGSLEKLSLIAELNLFMSKLKPAAVLLSGGNDPGIERDRDIVEMALLDFSEQHNLPVLGICRGMQMMAIRTGMGLKTVEGHTNCRQRITGEICGEVNSFHNYAVPSCPDDYHVLATALDGCIKAIRHNSLPWEGWMWHPEREEEFSDDDIDRLKGLVTQ